MNATTAYLVLVGPCLGLPRLGGFVAYAYAPTSHAWAAASWGATAAGARRRLAEYLTETRPGCQLRNLDAPEPSRRRLRKDTA